MAAPVHIRSRAARPTRTPFKKRRPFRSDQTVGALVVAFVVATLLGSQSLVELARQQPYGTSRTVSLTLAQGVDRVAQALSLDRPARAMKDWTGKTPPVLVDVEALVQRQAVVPPTTASTIPLDVNPATGLRYISVEEPLRVLLAGDSMMRELGTAMQELAPTDLTNIRLDYRISSGLSRPDYFDWPSKLAQLLDSYEPEAVVVLFGTNDHQDVEVNGRVLAVDSPEWLTEYHRRVGLVMDLLHRPGLTLTWVALPAMRSAGFSTAMARLSEVYRVEAASRPWVSLVNSGAAIDAADGSYAAALPAAGSEPVVMRQDDGVHFSKAGAQRAGLVVWGNVAQRWDLARAKAAQND